MRRVACVLSLLCVLVPASVRSAELVGLELNTVETAENRCRLTFVVENKAPRAIDSFKVDLVVFNAESIIQSRMLIEMGPVRAQKTSVKTFVTDGVCTQMSAILVNDITACTPADPAACLDGLALNSRVKGVRLYK